MWIRIKKKNTHLVIITTGTQNLDDCSFHSPHIYANFTFILSIIYP